ncbi:MAG: alpha/beta hydrolase, partial [Acidobacteriota bacterium]
MKTILCLLVVLVALSDSGFAQNRKVSAASPIELWPNGAPGATGNSDEDRPAIIPVLPTASNSTGAAVLICPGGGFMTRATDHEGVLVSQWLKARGIASFILRYRIRPLYSRREWLMDTQRAMQYIRANAREFRVAPNRVGIIGFSAGADLAYDATLNPLPGNPEAADGIERAGSRPDFQILVYGASPQRPPAESDKLAALPPAFMFCTAEDTGHIRGMSELYTEMLRAKVPVEAHFFLSGEHGVGFALGDPVLGEYPGLLMNWMIGNGFLTGGRRFSVSGVVKLDHVPLIRGMIILTPVD